MGYAWSKKYKVLNISVVTLTGESQADHQEAGQNQTKKRQLLQYQGIAGVFSLYKVRDLRHEMVTKRHTFVTNSWLVRPFGF